MSTEIGGRPVLRPAGNVAPALRTNIHHHARKQQTAKPPPSPAKKPSPPPPAASPPNSQPSTPKGTPAAALPGPQARSPVATVPVPQARSPKLPPRKSVPRISLNKSSNDVFQNSITTTTSTSSSSTKNANAKNARTQPPPKKSFSKLGSLSLDETSLADIVAAKKTAASELFLQRKFKVAEYGRKQGKVSRVAPDLAAPPLPPLEPRRCKFITPQTDALYVAYHDEEWGVPVHDDRRQFELLVLSGLLVDLSWSTILCKRDTYRVAFCGFDPVAVASFSEKHIQLLEADRSLTLRGGKIRGIVENARCILEVAHEFGSLDKYLWGFLNNKPMINSFRYPKQVPVKTSKSESISKDLVRRGFRFVGPTVIYSFMQSAGMTNDHLLECYRHQECSNTHLSSHQASQDISEHSQYYTSSDPCNISSLAMDMDHDTGKTV